MEDIELEREGLLNFPLEADNCKTLAVKKLMNAEISLEVIVSLFRTTNIECNPNFINLRSFIEIDESVDIIDEVLELINFLENFE